MYRLIELITGCLDCCTRYAGSRWGCNDGAEYTGHVYDVTDFLDEHPGTSPLPMRDSIADMIRRSGNHRVRHIDRCRG